MVMCSCLFSLGNKQPNPISTLKARRLLPKGAQHNACAHGSKIVSILAMSTLATQIVRCLFELDICPSQELKIKETICCARLTLFCVGVDGKPSGKVARTKVPPSRKNP